MDSSGGNMERNPHKSRIENQQEWAASVCKFLDDTGEVLRHFKLMLFDAFLLFSFGYTLYRILSSGSP